MGVARFSESITCVFLYILLQVKGDRKTIISGLQNAAEYTNPPFPLAKLSDFINLNS